ncbi:MAG TPA: adenylate/guanylate cyclase domain-containing protein [Albidovulum sp.]|uniref:adenylate/guanylate cyclase domain-containing protein n=1 Tax=Albidovulum sp. TaxID=1872424 RepID=UPI002BCC29B7|nr:adenylate/guanylate cyclase domain-containing protein [Paracoccaceae bacterium]HRV64206.1 adenylate/guanylate cyclase domain-containing protein [Albidovulum sp.]
MTNWVETLSGDVESTFNNAFDERDGRVVPESSDVKLSDGAVKIDAVFLYADLAGSAKIAESCPWDTTAKIIRAYLKCATRLIRAWEGHVRSFDGDRVMGVFIGQRPANNAVKCAREIFYTTENIIQPKAEKKFASVRNNNVKIRQACGVDFGTARAVRAGIRDNNDLIWIGKAPSLSAKLSDVREFPYCTFVSSTVYGRLEENQKKLTDGTSIWESRSFSFGSGSETIYRSRYTLRP